MRWKKIIEDLWFSNIYRAEDALKMTPKTKDIGRLIDCNGEDIMSTLTKQQKNTFEKYTKCQDELSMASERDIFVYAFRIGARIVAEVLHREWLGLYTIAKTRTCFDVLVFCYLFIHFIYAVRK